MIPTPKGLRALALAHFVAFHEPDITIIYAEEGHFSKPATLSLVYVYNTILTLS